MGRRLENPRIVAIGFGNQPAGRPARGARRASSVRTARGQLGQKRIGRLIDDGMDRIEPQRIDVKFIDPAQGVFDEISPHFVAAGPSKLMAGPQGV